MALDFDLKRIRKAVMDLIESLAKRLTIRRTFGLILLDAHVVIKGPTPGLSATRRLAHKFPHGGERLVAHTLQRRPGVAQRPSYLGYVGYERGNRTRSLMSRNSNSQRGDRSGRASGFEAPTSWLTTECSATVQFIERIKVGSPGRIRTYSLSVNSRTTNLIRTCRSWC